MNELSILSQLIVFNIYGNKYYGENERVIKDFTLSVLTEIKPKKQNFSSDLASDGTEKLRHILTSIMNIGENEPLNKEFLLSLIHDIKLSNEHEYEFIIDAINDLEEMKDEDIMTYIRSSKRNIAITKDTMSFQRILNNYSFNLSNKMDEIAISTNPNEKTKTILTELINELAPLTQGDTSFSGVNALPFVHSAFNINNEEDFSKHLSNAVATDSLSGRATLDLQGWNSAFSGRKDVGIPLGRMILFGALTGRGKSTSMYKMIRGIMCNNIAVRMDNNKQPLILIISLEDSADTIALKLYLDDIHEKTGERVDLENIKPEDAWKYIKGELTAKGYELEVVQCAALATKVSNVIEMIEFYESLNYEIHFMTVDYLQILDFSDMSDGNMSSQIKSGLTKLADYTRPKKITTVVAAQLNQKAVELSMESPNDFTSRVAGKSMLRECSAALDPVDIEVIGHIVQAEDEKWYHMLTVGKNRLLATTGTPASDERTAVYSLADGGVGFIPADINRDSEVRNMPGGAYRRDGGGMLW